MNLFGFSLIGYAVLEALKSGYQLVSYFIK